MEATIKDVTETNLNDIPETYARKGSPVQTVDCLEQLVRCGIKVTSQI